MAAEGDGRLSLIATTSSMAGGNRKTTTTAAQGNCDNASWRLERGTCRRLVGRDDRARIPLAAIDEGVSIQVALAKVIRAIAT